MSEALEIVKDDSNFALVIESAQAHKFILENCGQFQTVGDLGPKFYGLAFPKASDLTDEFSKQIIKYGADGSLDALKVKWTGSLDDYEKCQTQKHGLSPTNESGNYDDSCEFQNLKKKW